MQTFLSPGNLITLAGAVLTVVGAVAYGGGNANLSLPKIFYGIPILLGGLALKSSELPPASCIPLPPQQQDLRRAASAEPLRKLVADVTRWRYGQKAHLESSLEALKLWDDDNPPQLESIEELAAPGGYGLRLRFALGAVALERWQERQERLGRFFGAGLRAELIPVGSEHLLLSLVPAAPTLAESDQKQDLSVPPVPAGEP